MTDMKHIGELINQPMGGESQRTSKIDAATAKMVNMIFIRFEAIYTHKFKSAYHTDQVLQVAKREWAFSLQGYTDVQILSSIEKCKLAFDWPPTIAEFIRLIKPCKSDLGLPETRDAYNEACSILNDQATHNWSHPAVYFAGKSTDWFVLQNYPAKQSYPIFSLNYEKMCERVQNGEELSISIPKALTDQSQETMYYEVEQLIEKGVDPGVAGTLLYYLTKPKDTPTRKTFYNKSIALLEELNLDIELKE